VNSTVVADPTTVVADGVATSTITVTLERRPGQPIAGHDVSLNEPEWNECDDRSALPPQSDADGVVTFP